MKKKSVVALCMLGSLLASTPVVAAPLYSQWDSVNPMIIDPLNDDAPSGADITGIRYASVAGDHFFRMDVNGQIPLPGFTYTLYASNTPISSEYIFSGTSGINNTGIISFTKTFTNLTDSDDSTSRFRYTNNNTGSFFLEWSLQDDTALNNIFYLAGKTSVGSTPIDTTSVAPTPIPGAAWLFVSGILGLIGIRRKNTAV